jgi:mono/diheme cytochrome c family protein
VREVVGARDCSIDGSIFGNPLFRSGVPSMRFLQQVLTPADIQAISDYLNDPAFQGTITGQDRYLAGCAACHGVNARGGRVRESVRGKGAGSIAEAIREDRAMNFMGCLPASDLQAIGSYLRSLGRGGDHDDDRERDHDDD